MLRREKVRVLFICIGNACRSPMAEAIARRDADDVMECMSAGIFPLGSIPEETLTTLRVNGYPAEGLFSKAITSELWLGTDLFINLTGETISRAVPVTATLEHWNVMDPYGKDAHTYQGVFNDIRQRVHVLAEHLRK